MTTATLQARSLEPALTVNDFERSLRSYTEGLGFTITPKSEDDDEVKFAMGRSRIKGVGMRLVLETDQDLEVLVRQAPAPRALPVPGSPPQLELPPLLDEPRHRARHGATNRRGP
jgi:hypothetical protein